MGTQPPVTGWAVVIVGAIGLVANGIPVMVLLRDGDRENLNLRGALLHAAADLLGSAGAVVAGLLVLAGTPRPTRSSPPLIGVLVAATSFTLIRDSVRVLMEVAPGRAWTSRRSAWAWRRLPGVKQVHDLHVWTITSGMVAWRCISSRWTGPITTSCCTPPRTSWQSTTSPTRPSRSTAITTACSRSTGPTAARPPHPPA